MPTKDPDKLRAKRARWRAKNPDYNKNYWAKLRESNPEKVKAYSKRHHARYRLKNKHKIYARRQINSAINNGKIVRPDICQWCSVDSYYEDFIIEAHHEDYFKPMDIIWLCPDCHDKISS